MATGKITSVVKSLFIVLFLVGFDIWNGDGDGDGDGRIVMEGRNGKPRRSRDLKDLSGVS